MPFVTSYRSTTSAWRSSRTWPALLAAVTTGCGSPAPETNGRVLGLADAQGISWPANLWAGTTITAVSTTTRIDELLKVGNETTTRFLSVEPQLESLDLRPWLPRLDWIIQGGESGTEPRKFDLTWAQQLYWHCQETGTAYFLKQLGGSVFRGERRIRLRDHHGDDWSEWPKDVPRVRQIPGPKACPVQRPHRPRDTSAMATVSWGPKYCHLTSAHSSRVQAPSKPFAVNSGRMGTQSPSLSVGHAGVAIASSQRRSGWPRTFFSRKALTSSLGRTRSSAAAARFGRGALLAPAILTTWNSLPRSGPSCKRILRMKFWGYTKSWTVPAIWEELLKLGAEPNMVLWLSWDRKMAEHHGAPPDRTFPWVLVGGKR